MLWLVRIVTPLAHADVDTFIHKVNTYLLNPAIQFFFVLAIAYFIYGIYEYLRDSSSGEGREKGTQHMMWGLVGLAIMSGVWIILRIVLGTLGIDESQIDPQTQQVDLSDD